MQTLKRQLSNTTIIDNTLRERERVEDEEADLSDVVGGPEEMSF